MGVVSHEQVAGEIANAHERRLGGSPFALLFLEFDGLNGMILDQTGN